MSTTIEIKKMDTEDIIEYLENPGNKIDLAKKQSILSQALSYGKIKVIQHLMDQDITCDNVFSYKGLMKKKTSTKILSYLEDKGVDLTMGNHVLLFDSACNQNYPFFEYLFEKLKIDTVNDRLIKVITINLIGIHESSDSPEPVPYFEKFLPLITDDNFKEVLPNFFKGTEKQICNNISILEKIAHLFTRSQSQLTLDILQTQLSYLKEKKLPYKNQVAYPLLSTPGNLDIQAKLLNTLWDNSLDTQHKEFKKNKI